MEDIKRAKTSSRIKQLMSEYEADLLNPSLDLTVDQRTALIDGRDKLQEKLAGITAKTYLEKAAAISELSVFIYENVPSSSGKDSKAEVVAAAVSAKNNLHAQLSRFRAIARRWNEITLDIPDALIGKLDDDEDMKDSDDDSDADSDDDEDDDDNDYTMYTDHWAMSFAFNKEDGNAKIKTFTFDSQEEVDLVRTQTSDESERVRTLLTKYVDSKDWHTFEEEVGLLVVMQRVVDSSTERTTTEEEFSAWCQAQTPKTNIVERSTMDETTYLNARTNNGTINSTQLFRNLMMGLPPMENMLVKERILGNHVRYRLRRSKRSKQAIVHMSPPIAIGNVSGGYNFPEDQNTLWRACYSSYSTYRAEHDKLTSDVDDVVGGGGSRGTLGNGSSESSESSGSRGSRGSRGSGGNRNEGSASAISAFATIEPSMHDMHVMCHKLLVSGSQVLVCLGETSSVHYHRMVFSCHEDEGLQLMSIAIKEDAMKREHLAVVDNEESKLLSYGEQLAVDSSEILGRWYRQNVVSTLFPLSTSTTTNCTTPTPTPTQTTPSSLLTTIAHVQHILGSCVQSVSLENGLCPYYTDGAINIKEMTTANMLSLVWRVKTVSDRSFIFSAERITKQDDEVGGQEIDQEPAEDNTVLRSLKVDISGQITTYCEVGEDEKTGQQVSTDTPLPVMLSKYINKWTSKTPRGRKELPSRGKTSTGTKSKRSKNE